jgi:hypothetical protein
MLGIFWILLLIMPIDWLLAQFQFITDTTFTRLATGGIAGITIALLGSHYLQCIRFTINRQCAGVSAVILLTLIIVAIMITPLYGAIIIGSTLIVIANFTIVLSIVSSRLLTFFII